MSDNSELQSTTSQQPSRNWQASLGLAVLGLVVSGYLTWVKLTGNLAACGPVGDCQSVNSSPYAEIFGVPIALFGAGAYLVILVALAVEQRRGPSEDVARLGVFGVSLVGILYSAYLTYLEVAVLKAICPYCVVSAIAMTLILILSVVQLRPAEL